MAIKLVLTCCYLLWAAHWLLRVLRRMDWDFASGPISDCGLGSQSPHWRWRFAGQRNSDSRRLVTSLHSLSWDHGQATWLASKADIKTGSLISRAFSISSSCMITTYSLKLSCVTLYLTKPMTWSWGGSEVVLMTLIFNSQRSISGEPIGPDKTIQINIKSLLQKCLSLVNQNPPNPAHQQPLQVLWFD